MPGRRSLSRAVLAVALCVAAGACSDAGEDAEPAHTVCPPAERRVLLAEKLTRSTPSSPFTVAAGEEAWASVVADADYNPSALFPTWPARVASRDPGLYRAPTGTEPPDAMTAARCPPAGRTRRPVRWASVRKEDTCP